MNNEGDISGNDSSSLKIISSIKKLETPLIFLLSIPFVYVQPRLLSNAIGVYEEYKRVCQGIIVNFY